MMSATMCVHTAHSNGTPNCHQNFHIVEPSGVVSDHGDHVEDVDSHTSNPTDADDQKW
jgi:hypothetical protein